MFNDLNANNNPAHSAVDDIFAETDKMSDSAPAARNSSPAAAAAAIDTHKVGLTANENVSAELSEAISDNKWFKIVIGAIVLAIILLGGYLIYDNFLAPKTKISNTGNLVTKATSTNTAKPVQSVQSVQSAVSLVSTTSMTDQTNAGGGVASSAIPYIPGVNAPSASSTSTTTDLVASSTELVVGSQAALDADGDGLSDAEEKLVGTNINLADTDGDGLSDYEEVKIYHTDPLNKDTDGDGYLDGAEVKNGYNPNGAGKMPKLSSSTSKISSSSSPVKK